MIGPADGTLRVLIATPLGLGGRGGIDRIVDGVRAELAAARPEGVAVTVTATRGQGHIALSVFHLGWSILRLVGLRLAGRVDVLHVNLSSHGSTVRKVILCRVARLLGVPYVIHLHGSRFRQFYEARGPFVARQIASMFRGAARTVVLGQVWKTFVLGRVPEVADRLEILPNASRGQRRPPPLPTEPVSILFLGQVGERKGVPQLLDALQRLPDIPPWRATLAGDGRVEEMRGRAARLGLDGSVAFTGWVGPAEVERLLDTASILALPSFDENLPMSVIEAMSYGLAVVATRVGAVEDIILPEQTGLLVPAGDVPQLAAALERLVADPCLRRRLGAGAQAFHRQNLDMGQYLHRLIAIWRHAAQAKQPADQVGR